MLRNLKTLCWSLTVCLVLVISAPAQLTVLHSFSGPDGASPTGLVQSNGYLYGATAAGGDTAACPNGCGTLFRSDTSGNVIVLHMFHGSDGYIPTGLMKAADGSFYGTTMSGGQPLGGGSGTIFRLDSAGNFTTLYSFTGGFVCCAPGGPSAPPTQAADGNFYGSTGAGGAYRDVDHQGGFGTVYQFNPTSGTVTVLHSFNLADGNGINPVGPLIQAKDLYLYGTAPEGGATGGTLFKIDTAGNFSLVANINVPSSEPRSGVIQAKVGSFYGTEEGVIGSGTVFRVDGSGNVVALNRFDTFDGYKPTLPLLEASDSLFYGTAPRGGLLDFTVATGDLFRITPSGILTVLHTFVAAEGAIPNSALVQGSDGRLYGTMGIGGSGGSGTLFRYDQTTPTIVASVVLDSNTITFGQTTTGTISLSRPAPKGGTVVTLQATGFGAFALPSTVWVHAGKTTARFKVSPGTFAPGVPVTERIYASVAGQGVRTTITITP